MKLSDLKEAPFNPRTINKEALTGLGCSIREFGDLSGITYNKKSGNLVSGHQRVKSLIEQYGDLEIENGNITIPGKNIKFKVRTVNWSRKREKAANLAANSQHISGQWTAELGTILEEIKVELPSLHTDLRLDALQDDIPQIPDPTKTVPKMDENASKEEWIPFAVGEKKGVIQGGVYLLFCSEWDRLSGIVESGEITPIIEAMVANSANTPEESLK